VYKYLVNESGEGNQNKMSKQKFLAIKLIIFFVIAGIPKKHYAAGSVPAM